MFTLRSQDVFVCAFLLTKNLCARAYVHSSIGFCVVHILNFSKTCFISIDTHLVYTLLCKNIFVLLLLPIQTRALNKKLSVHYCIYGVCLKLSEQFHICILRSLFTGTISQLMCLHKHLFMSLNLQFLLISIYFRTCFLTHFCNIGETCNLPHEYILL
jgi:hypothetical protein